MVWEVSLPETCINQPDWDGTPHVMYPSVNTSSLMPDSNMIILKAFIFMSTENSVVYLSEQFLRLNSNCEYLQMPF